MNNRWGFLTETMLNKNLKSNQNDKVFFDKLGNLKNIKFETGHIKSRLECKEESELNTKNCYILNPTSIEDGLINHNDLSLVKVQIDKLNNLRFATANSIILRISSPYNAAISTTLDEDLIVSSFCIRITIDENDIIDTYYLLAFLNSKLFHDQMVKLSQGSIAFNVSIEKLMEVRVPLPSLDKQQLIGKAYKALIEQTRSMKKIIEYEKEFNDSYFLGLEEI